MLQRACAATLGAPLLALKTLGSRRSRCVSSAPASAGASSGTGAGARASAKVSPPSRPAYLDLQATTPLDPRVLDAMLPWEVSRFGNAHSRTHAYGWEAEAAVEKARAQVAALIGAGACVDAVLYIDA